jgi:hypothetical protein
MRSNVLLTCLIDMVKVAAPRRCTDILILILTNMRGMQRPKGEA